MLEWKINRILVAGFNNPTIRNGVAIFTQQRCYFCHFGSGINFYDFAKYFKELGCKNALYLDGFVSRINLPEKGMIVDSWQLIIKISLAILLLLLLFLADMPYGYYQLVRLLVLAGFAVVRASLQPDSYRVKPSL